jgi:hypothetical protein
VVGLFGEEYLKQSFMKVKLEKIALEPFAFLSNKIKSFVF